MVDERADAPSTLGYGRPGGDGWRVGTTARMGESVAGWVQSRVGALFAPGPGGEGVSYRLPVAVTGIWLMALGAYAIGYFERLGAEAEAGVPRALPTMDLLFFAFAVVGPVLMLWLVFLLQARAAKVTEALTAQSESALALAATVAGLHEAVETLSAGTTGRIAEAASVVERDGAAAMARLDATLEQLGQRLDTGLLDAVVMLDRNLRERSAKADAALDTQRDALARRLDAGAERLAQRLEEDAERLARMIEAQARGMEAAQSALGERIASSLTAHGNRLEQGTSEILDALRARLEQVAEGVDAAMRKLAADMGSEQRNRHRDMDADMRKREVRLHAAVDEVARAIEGGVAPLLGEIRIALGEMGGSIAANPPATAAELARLLGEAAEREIQPERLQLEGAVGRIAALEKQAERLIERIDRTARLNPLMEPPAVLAPANAAAGPELPFADLPRGASRAVLDWTAVVHALDGRRGGGEAGRRATEKAAADPDVAAVGQLAAQVAKALAEDGLHLSDLAPVHAPAALWQRFARGERGGEVELLAGIEDEIALAIARARLRDDAAFRALALRLVAAYARLLTRAVGEIGADPRLVELAETPPGRAFMLLAGLTHAFRPVPCAAE